MKVWYGHARPEGVVLKRCCEGRQIILALSLDLACTSTCSRSKPQAGARCIRERRRLHRGGGFRRHRDGHARPAETKVPEGKFNLLTDQ